MAEIQGIAGVNLTQELANYLDSSRGNVDSQQIASIVNQYLVGGDKLAAQGAQVGTNVFRRFLETDVVAGKLEVVTTGLWSGDTGSLNSFFTSSAEKSSDTSMYYVNVYQEDPSSTSATVQFAIAYGHRLNYGSRALSTSDDALFATRATYSQYRTILLEEDQERFLFYSSSDAGTHASDDIYVINVSRSRYKERMDAGNWALTLSGSNGIFTFIDDSGKKFDDTVGKAGRVFYIGSGSLNLGQEAEATISSLVDSNGRGFGLFYPDQGLMVFNPTALEDVVGTSINISSVGGSTRNLGTTTEAKNHFLMYNYINASGSGDFEARRTENVSTSHYFVRATNREFNFSNNPTFVTGSDGTFRESSFVRDPKTYITTVGLYNDANELLAVAKTSQPIPKSFDKEVLIKVKLDF